MTKIEDGERLCNCPYCNAIQHGDVNENITCQVCGCKYHYIVNKTYITTNTEEDYKNIISTLVIQNRILNIENDKFINAIDVLNKLIDKLKSCNKCMYNNEMQGVKNTRCKACIKPTNLPGVYEYTLWSPDV